MSALRLSELQELLRTAAFAAWRADLAGAEAARKSAEARRRDLGAEAGLMDLRAELAGKLAADAFSRAGEIESQAAHLGAEAQLLENRALELVAVFEKQRYQVSGLWYRLGDAERILEERREALAAAGLRAGRDATRIAQAQVLVEQGERQCLTARDEYDREAREKARLWAEVEGAWGRSFELSLLGAERGASVQGVRREAERLFEEAEQRSARARELSELAAAAAHESELTARRREELLAQAHAQFHCIAGQRLLYWRRRADPKGAWAVPLPDDGEAAGSEPRAPVVYAVCASRGELLLEPASENLAASGEEEPRFEEWLLRLRREPSP